MKETNQNRFENIKWELVGIYILSLSGELLMIVEHGNSDTELDTKSRQNNEEIRSVISLDCNKCIGAT